VKLGIMQPYFFPYIGYFQLIHAVDLFVVYDNVKYTKKGWINRNRYLLDGAAAVFSLPLAAGSDSLDVRDRYLADSFDRRHFLARIAQAYRRAPFFAPVFAFVEETVGDPERNLFRFLYRSLQRVCSYLEISTPLVPSSEIPIDHALRSQERVLAICKQTGASVYVNPAGGRHLYARDAFARESIELQFLEPRLTPYPQLGDTFVPALSILDVMMFNSPSALREQLASGYELVDATA
jgi:hypothetical protein